MLRPGGRLVLAHSDFDTLVFASEDLELTHRLVRDYCDTQQPWMDAVDGTIGRRLDDITGQAGLQVEDVQAAVVLGRRFVPGEIGSTTGGLLFSVNDYAVLCGRVRSWLRAAVYCALRPRHGGGRGRRGPSVPALAGPGPRCGQPDRRHHHHRRCRPAVLGLPGRPERPRARPAPVPAAGVDRYPLCDVLLVAVAVRLWRTGGHGTAASRLLTVGLVALLAADTVYGLSLLSGGWDAGGPVDATWIVFYLGVGLAALHPSAERADRRRRDRRRFGRAVPPHRGPDARSGQRGGHAERAQAGRADGAAGDRAGAVRLAADLHDGPVQELTALRYGLTRARNRIQRGHPTRPRASWPSSRTSWRPGSPVCAISTGLQTRLEPTSRRWCTGSPRRR